MSGLRGQFSSRLGFILATAGSAVGIGNLVGFPVMASKNGGAAFLLIYILFVALICFPVMIAEIAMGRASQRSPVGAFSSLSNNSLVWRMAGTLAVLTPFMIAVFYTVITVWIGYYMIHSALGKLEVLAEPETFSAVLNSPIIFFYLAGLMALVFLILSGGVKDGIEKAAKIMMPSLMILLVLLVIFVLFQDNAAKGLAYYLVPDFSKIDSSVINGALNQAFFSLSLGMGILITYGSYLGEHERIVSSTRFVAITDTSVALTAGLLIIPAIFVVNPEVNAEELSDSSIGLMFSYLPQIFLSFQDLVGYFGASVIATVFFTLVFFAALTSLVSITEIPIAWMVDEKGVTRRKALRFIGIAMAIFVVLASLSFGMVGWLTEFLSYGGLNKSFFDLILDVFYETILPFIGFIVCLFCAYRWNKQDFINEVAQDDARYPNSLLANYVGFALGTFIPLILLAVFINNVATIFFGARIFGF